ncbi:hypothetical protein B9R42_17550 [Arthrospira platensis PCC 7345]|nr:hypothetical protein NIES39_M00370 [Arthrospira platensis NIES-39]
MRSLKPPHSTLVGWVEERNPTPPSLTLPSLNPVGFHPTYYHLCWVSPNLQGLVGWVEERNPTLPSLTLQGLLLGFTQPTRFTVGFHPTYKVYCWVSPNLLSSLLGFTQPTRFSFESPRSYENPSKRNCDRLNLHAPVSPWYSDVKVSVIMICLSGVSHDYSP